MSNSTNKEKKEIRTKAWAVIDTSRRLYPRKDYIDVNYEGVSLAVYISKAAGKAYHKDFKGKKVVRCEIIIKL